MASRNTFNPGTFAPRKYTKFLVTYAAKDPAGTGTIATYKYYVTGRTDNDVLIAEIELETDGDGNTIRGEIISGGI